MKTDFAKAFRVVRAACGLSQAELAHRLGISASHLSLIEHGRRQPSLKVIGNLAQVAGVPPSLVMLLASPSRGRGRRGRLRARQVAACDCSYILPIVQQRSLDRWSNRNEAAALRAIPGAPPGHPPSRASRKLALEADAHYRRWEETNEKTGKVRRYKVPIAPLKAVQRRILRRILNEYALPDS